MSSNSLGKCPLCLNVMLVKNFKRHCKNCHNSVDSQEKYEKLLLKFKENLLAKAFDYLLTMPVTVASVERSFSKMKIVKNRLQTRMDDERLYSLLSCALETSTLDKLDSTEILEKWLNNKTHRRISI